MSCSIKLNENRVYQDSRLISGVGSASKLRDFDDWQDPRVSTTDEDLISPYSDSSTNDLDQIQPQDLSKSGTYVIRRGRKKERKVLPKSPDMSPRDENHPLTDFKRYSSTFDNIRSLLKDNKIEDLSQPPSGFENPAMSSDLVRVVSLPVINNTDANNASREQLGITFEEEESSDLSEKEKDKSEDKSEDFDEMDQECNGLSKNLDVKVTVNTVHDDQEVMRKNSERHETKIPVNVLIEEHIVKKALNENRRQLEKVGYFWKKALCLYTELFFEISFFLR